MIRGARDSFQEDADSMSFCLCGESQGLALVFFLEKLEKCLNSRIPTRSFSRRVQPKPSDLSILLQAQDYS
jgi:sugar lactone lactonase YvrE